MIARPIHLVGIGGAGMSALARLAVECGYRVSGSDRDESALLGALRARGVDARAGHAAANVPSDAATVVASTAIPADNPELVAAASSGIPIVHRSAFLAELMSRRRGLAVAGAHGKSTTSAMLALALGDSSACIGAAIPGGDGTGARWGGGPWFVAEADESDRSLLALSPEGAILLNVDHDHHATFASLEEVEEVMGAFAASLPPPGVLVVGSDPRARACVRAARCEVRTVGASGDFVAFTGSGRDAALRLPGGRTLPMPLAVPGRHNAENAACALTLAHWCGVDFVDGAGRIETFTGVGRRFETVATVAGVRIVDDYAHHPAEVRATLGAARETHSGRVIAIFQPHLVSRTRALGEELGAALSAADMVIVTDVYVAREAPDPDVDGRRVADAVGPATETHYVPSLADVARFLGPKLRRGDLVLTIGAGDVTRLGQDIAGMLENVRRDERLS